MGKCFDQCGQDLTQAILGGVAFRSFTNIQRCEEEYEHAFFTAMGDCVIGTTHDWPHVRVACDFRTPLYFGDSVAILLTISKTGKTSLG